MSCLIYSESRFQLTHEKLEKILAQIKSRLAARVKAAYIFGSASSGEFTDESDIDLILVKDEVSEPFMHRPLEFKDIYDLWPRIDMLVYTPEELECQLAGSAVGFWRSVRASMKRLI